MPNPDKDTTTKPSVYPVQFTYTDGKPCDSVYVYLDIPGDNQFKLENKWKTDTKGNIKGKLVPKTDYNFYLSSTERSKSWLESNIKEEDCTKIKTEVSGKKIVVKLPKVVYKELKVLSLAFTSDHGKLKDYADDWQNKGDRFPQPEWKAEHSHPISHTMDKNVEIEIELEAGPENAPNKKARLVGKGPGDHLSFEGDIDLVPGKSKHKLTAKGKLAKKIDDLKDLAIEWKLTPTGDDELDGKKTEGHRVFVTVDDPADGHGTREDGITLKRMEQAVKWVKEANTLDPHAIVNKLMKKYKYYVLYPSEKVPKKFNHPSYFNDIGGAWPMVDYRDEYGECQAIVRIVRAHLWQVGVPGDANIYVVWSEPKGDDDAETKEGDWEKNSNAGLNVRKWVDSKTWAACLVDGEVEEGKVYPPSHSPMPGGGSSPGLNRYEACLRFAHNGVTKYYGGGAGVFNDKDEVILAFWALIWVSWESTGGYKVEKIVKKYAQH